jgi:hypothetical protein
VTTDLSPAELAALCAKVERELARADPKAVLDVLVASATEMVPGAEQAGVTVGRRGRFTTDAATDAVVHQVDAIQYRLGGGPCVDAIVQDTVFNALDLGADGRWPDFGREAFETTGIASMLSFRLFFEDDADAELVAGLNLYAREPGAFGEASENIGLLVATHGALAVAGSAARQRAENLMTALKNSRDIGVAMGILMQKLKVTRDEAFNLLRMVSQQTHRRLADIATSVADTGELPEPPARRD